MSVCIVKNICLGKEELKQLETYLYIHLDHKEMLELKYDHEDGSKVPVKFADI